MHIADVRTYLVQPATDVYPKNLLFVRLETNDGIVGWGECYTYVQRDRPMEILVHEMAKYLEGRSPFNVKHFSQVMYSDFVGKRGSHEFYSALSGLEMALWDINGKALGQPVYNLLGGACRSRIRVYANGWAHGDHAPDEVARKALDLVEQGFSAMKWDPFPGPYRTHISRADEQAAVASLRAVREAVGPNVDLLMECHRRLAPHPAIRMARLAEPFDPFWFEEPVSARNLSALAEVRSRINLPVVTGEELYTKTEFREVFDLRAADILNPDVCNTGGILELREIAAMAEPYGIVMSPHNYNSTTVGLAATVQASAGMPNFLITEYFVNFEQLGRRIARKPLLQEGGYVALPTEPGLGIELDEAALLERKASHDKVKSIRQFDQEGP